MSDTIDTGAVADAPGATERADDARYEAAIAEEAARDTGAADTAPAEGEGEGDAAPPDPTNEVKRLERRMGQKHAALQQERQARKALEARLAAAEAARPRPVEVRPDPEIDPIGYMKYVEARLSAQDEAAARQRAEVEAQQAQTRQVHEIVSRADEAEKDFADSNPDYYQAVEFLRQSRARELMALGYAPQDAEAVVNTEALRTAHEMLARGQDPARGWYELARVRGFSAGSGGARSKLDTIEAGQRAARSLSSGGGRPNGDLSAGSVANLKGAAFDQAFERLRSAARDAERRTGY